MLFRQFVDDDLGCASYLIGDESSGEALVVDPAFAVEQYLEAAEDEGVRSSACWRRTRTRTMCPAMVGLRSSTAFRSRSIPWPSPTIRSTRWHTPTRSRSALSGFGLSTLRATGPSTARFGHRPGSGRRPWLTLTGDSLFVGDAARPDLAVEAAEGARELYRSLQRLLELSTESKSTPVTSPARSAAPG